jgi:hypothetical protein
VLRAATLKTTRFLGEPYCSSIEGKQPYDVGLSFAGEDRDYVEAVAAQLVSLGVKVFYDRYETASLWGKDLYQHLSNVYKQASYSVIFISCNYATRLWTKHELKSAQAKAFRPF